MADDDVLAVVGSTKFVNVYGLLDARYWIEGVLDRRRPDLLVSGGAKGIDQLAAQVAGRAGVPVREFLPAHQRWEPDGFRDRNDQIAAACTRLLRITCRWATTYGSGYTYDRAREQGKLCFHVMLPGQPPQEGIIRVTHGRATQVDLPVHDGRVSKTVPKLARELGWTLPDPDELITLLLRQKYPVRWIPGEL